eukprot:CAMPEP_0171834812 /NCGR_PEP_ID=MMETSP0992-20121227/10615_1 /TAXON_ID=483369 /ORGANISM="non described non described, Strain CCMP2098" /LENGTH=201 /DNA_ID=CAMNT_0012450525 /DNA_START=143 /DNA_END=746 /DNA_ORIENTATION=-
MKEVHERIVRVKSRPKTSLPIAKSTPQNLASPNSEHNDTDLSEASSLTLLKARRTPIGDDEAHAWLEANGFEVDNLRRPLDPGKSTVWHLAVEDSNLPMLQWLYDNGAAEDIRRPDDASITPLQISSMKRDLAVTRWLFSHGAADVYKFNPYFGEGVANAMVDLASFGSSLLDNEWAPWAYSQSHPRKKLVYRGSGTGGGT